MDCPTYQQHHPHQQAAGCQALRNNTIHQRNQMNLQSDTAHNPQKPSCTYNGNDANLINGEDKNDENKGSEEDVLSRYHYDTEEEKTDNKRLHELSNRFSHRVKEQTIYRGMLLNMTTTPQGIEVVNEATLRPDDWLVCGYPKSGTTWLEEVVYLLRNNGDVEEAGRTPCYMRVPLFEDMRVHGYIESMKSPRILKTHVPYEFLPREITATNKIIYIIRNPKDVAVSLYYFYISLTELNNYKGTWCEFIDMFINGYVIYAGWFKHVNSWTGGFNKPNIYLVTYEDMKKNPEKTIAELNLFLMGEEIDSNILDRIVKHTDFKAMKDNPSTNFAGVPNIKTPFMRKGEVGDWKNHFTVTQNSNFDTVIQNKIKNKQLLKLLQYDI